MNRTERIMNLIQDNCVCICKFADSNGQGITSVSTYFEHLPPSISEVNIFLNEIQCSRNYSSLKLLSVQALKVKNKDER